MSKTESQSEPIGEEQKIPILRRLALSACKKKFSAREDLINAIKDFVTALNEVKVKFGTPGRIYERIQRIRNDRESNIVANLWGHANVKELGDGPEVDPFNENPVYLISRLLEKITTLLKDTSLKSESLRNAVIECIAAAQIENNRYFAKKIIMKMKKAQ